MSAATVAGAGKIAPIAPAAEFGATGPLGRARARPVGIATETGDATATRIGQAAETGVDRPAAARKARGAGGGCDQDRGDPHACPVGACRAGGRDGARVHAHQPVLRQDPPPTARLGGHPNTGGADHAYSIKPKVVRIGDATPRGYVRADFADAWARYLEPDPQQPQQPQQRNYAARSVADQAALHVQPQHDPERNTLTSDVAPGCGPLRHRRLAATDRPRRPTRRPRLNQGRSPA